MKIIKPGDSERLKAIIQFECPRCGCVFEAEKSEYRHEFSQREGIGWYRVTCPTCHYSVTKDEK